VSIVELFMMFITPDAELKKTGTDLEVIRLRKADERIVL
jgi:hypothetical protein